MTPHYKRHCGARDFARNATKLRIELKLNSARRHLANLVELLHANLRDAGDSLLARDMAAELEELETLVKSRVRLVVIR